MADEKTTNDELGRIEEKLNDVIYRKEFEGLEERLRIVEQKLGIKSY